MTNTDCSNDSLKSIVRIVLKATVLLVIVNSMFALLNPVPLIGRLSIYNWLVPGRERLPFGENSESYNLSILQLDAIFASHEVSQPKEDDEYRVIVIGDSSVWGILLEPEETLAGQITSAGYITPDGLRVRAYNLGYPTISVMKDLLVLSRVMNYEPDMIIWLTTLEALPQNKQTSSPLVQENPAEVGVLIDAYELNVEVPAGETTFSGRTIVGQRRVLADILRLNLYGVMWAATGIDQIYPEYDPLQNDFEEDKGFYDLEQPLQADDLALDVIDAGVQLAEDVPVLIVNEPIFISDGENSDIRYNFYYPRWAYDDYREIMREQAISSGWAYIDLWNTVPPTEFTNSAIHITPDGTEVLVTDIAQIRGWKSPQ